MLEILKLKIVILIGFRNIAVHDYKEIDGDILKDVIENGLEELRNFARITLNLK